MNTVFRFRRILISFIVSLSMLCSCGSLSTSDKEGHVVRPLFSSSLWNAIRSWDILPSTNSTLALWSLVLIGICSVIFVYKKYNRIFPAVAVAVIGMCQIYFFLGYTGRLEEICGSYLLTLLLVIALTAQVLVTDKIAIDHDLTGDYYTRKDTGIIGIIWSLSVIIVSLLYYIFTDFLGWSIMGWILKLLELWLLALIVNLTYGAVTDRFDTKESDSKVYYISAGVISFIGFLITISYNTFAGYIASVIAIIYLVPKYLGSHKADTRIREAADAEELAKIQKEHSKARHVVYAYRIDGKTKSCDDREPKGTAGRPLLELLMKKDLNKVALVVVRYFGGTLLGAGRLLRTYVQSGVNVLKEAGIE